MEITLQELKDRAKAGSLRFTDRNNNPISVEQACKTPIMCRVHSANNTFDLYYKDMSGEVFLLIVES